MTRQVARLFGWRQAAAAVVAAAALSPVTGQAFTLIQPVVKLYVNPSAGYTTSYIQVRGTMVIQGTCPTPPTTFRFFFDGASLWNKNVNVCNPNTFIWDTSWSAYIKPPVAPTVGSHTIQVNVYLYNGSLAGTAKYTYRIYAAPASPRPPPSPSPSTAAPSPTPSASPSASGCPATGALPPAGTGGMIDNFITTSMTLAVLPLIGLALFGPSRLLSTFGRRRRILEILGLTLLVAATLSCTSSVAEGPNQSPVGVVSPSPSPSPSPSC